MKNKEVKRHFCWKCKTTKNLSVDHIFPKKWGGLNISANRMTLCRRCHDIKEEKTRRWFKSDGTVAVIHPFLNKPFHNPVKEVQ